MSTPDFYAFVDDSDSSFRCHDRQLTDEWFERLTDEVEFQCSFCEGVLLSIAELEEKARRGYEATARSMKGFYDTNEIANRWLATFLLLSEIHGVAKAAQQLHPICGADLSSIEALQDAALERYKLHCPPQLSDRKGVGISGS